MTQALFDFDNSYARLPDRLFARLSPTPVKTPAMIRLNDGLAEVLGLDAKALCSTDGVAVLAGNAVAPGSDPLAMAYAGHQFGNWVPKLGDGRALLLGEVVGTDGLRRDIQLKGSGPTPFSRMGDGRAWLGPVLREYLVSEAMAALDIPTTRALAAVETGEAVLREEGPLPGAVLTRVARAHIRVGTFQYFAARQDTEALRALADHCITRLYPDLEGAENPYLSLLETVIWRQADLVSRWMSVGFIHGVMNTDNMSIAGETIDYGPCAFMDAYDPKTVFSFIDQMGRYSYQNQPGIAQWNLANLAQSLLPLLDTSEDKAVQMAQGAIDEYPAIFDDLWTVRMLNKIGLQDRFDGDDALLGQLLGAMSQEERDFTLTFRGLSGLIDPGAASDQFADSEGLQDWLPAWRLKLQQQGRDAQTIAANMDAANPAIIPRNHLVEAAIQSAHQAGDFKPFHQLADALEAPFKTPGDPMLMRPPAPSEAVHQTFCGT